MLEFRNTYYLFKKVLIKGLIFCKNPNVYNSIWLISGAIISKTCIFISMLIISRVYGKIIFGQVSLINSTIIMMAAVLGLNLDSFATKNIAENKIKNTRKVIEIYWAIVLATIIICSIVLILVYNYEIDSTKFQIDKKGIIIIGLISIFSIINTVQCGMLSGFEKFKILTSSNVIKSILQSLLIVMGANIFGINGILLGLLIPLFVSNAMNFYFIKNELVELDSLYSTKSFLFSRKVFISIWRFSFPITISSIIMIPVVWWSKTNLVGSFGYAALANFEVAEQWRSQILFIPASISTIFLPNLAREIGIGNYIGVIKVIKYNAIINILISSSLCVIVCIFSSWILNSYGKDYHNYTTLFVLSFSSILISLSNILIPILISFDKLWFGVFINSIWALIFVCLVNILLEKFAEDGLAYSILICYTTTVPLQFLYSFYLIKKRIAIKNLS